MNTHSLLSRRHFLLGTGSIGLASVLPLGATSSRAGSLKVGMLIPGHIDDGGFMEAGYKGLQKIENELGAGTEYIDQIEWKLEALSNALRKLAAQKPNLIIAHGGNNNDAVKAVAPDFPDIQFVVVQGNVTGDNISSYEVLQEQSAWLGGALAGLMTKTGTVGHISGVPVPPGLKGRAAFANGLKHTKPDAKFLTVFCGAQDDVELAAKAAEAEIQAGADIIFTMLNAGRVGAIDKCRAHKVLQIGNVRDWYPTAPDVFVASAISNAGLAGFRAAADVAAGKFAPGNKVHIGLEMAEAVSLAMAPNVSDNVRSHIENLANRIVRKEIVVSTEWSGEEIKI
jgi:basic membrane protein A